MNTIQKTGRGINLKSFLVQRVYRLYLRLQHQLSEPDTDTITIL